MSQDFSSRFESFKEYFYLEPDPRTGDWPLMSSPWPSVYLIGAYIAIVTVIGPWFMKNRKPYDLRNVLVVYSGAQMLFSSWMFYEAAMGGWFTHYNWRCQSIDRSTSPIAMRMANVWWWYYISKFTEFFDTFFFILRKKNEHITALHVYHHAVMPAVWIGPRFAPGGHMSFFVLINSFVHVVMYTYYMISAMGPQYAKFLWWKKYITMIQLIQFAMGILHASQLAFYECDSGFPKHFLPVYITYALFFILLFSDFYKSTYKPKSESKPLQDQSNGHIEKSEKLKVKPTRKQEDWTDYFRAGIALVAAIFIWVMIFESSIKPKPSGNFTASS